MLKSLLRLGTPVALQYLSEVAAFSGMSAIVMAGFATLFAVLPAHRNRQSYFDGRGCGKINLIHIGTSTVTVDIRVSQEPAIIEAGLAGQEESLIFPTTA